MTGLQLKTIQKEQIDGMFVNMETAMADYYTVMYMMNYKCGYSHVCMVNKSNNDQSWEISHNKKSVKDRSFVKQKYKKHIQFDEIDEFSSYILCKLY